MKRIIYLAGLIVSVVGIAHLTSIPSFAQSTGNAIDAPTLKAMIQGLGYETKDLSTTAGKEKIEFSIAQTDFNVPIAAELSTSKNYIWLTVFLGADSGKHKYQDILKQNAKIQPVQFYITSTGNLMMGVAVDNRSVTPAVLRRNVEMLTKDVSDSSTVWNVK